MGICPPGVTAKDMILALIAKIGIGGGTGYVFEYTGIGGAGTGYGSPHDPVQYVASKQVPRAGMIAPDDTTFAYLKGRPHAPQGAAWEAALAAWRNLPSDPGASYDQEIYIDASTLEPMVTYGTNPGMGAGIGSAIPDPAGMKEIRSDAKSLVKALSYMGLTPAIRWQDIKWMLSSWAVAPMAGYRTCAWSPRC